MGQSLDELVISLEINEARQVYDKLDDDKKQELTNLLHYPMLMTTLAKQLSEIMKNVISSIPLSSDLDKIISQKLTASYETLDDTILISGAIIKRENEKFLMQTTKSDNLEKQTTKSDNLENVNSNKSE